MYRYILPLLILLYSIPSTSIAEEHLRMATTTSTDNSGLLPVLNPPFEKKYGVKLDVIAVGTGKALRLGQDGNVDLVFVHAPPAEIKFVESGYGVDRQPVMHNDFVLLGPPSDPAGLRQATSIKDAMARIAAASAPFISRGDDSGTDKKEKQLWSLASIKPQGDWYMSAGQGMGAVLKIADDKLAYTLSDRGTYLAFRDKMALVVVYEGAKELYNPYHIILVNPKQYPDVKYDLAKRYSDFVRGPEGQKIIGDYRVAGEQLFHPDVIK